MSPARGSGPLRGRRLPVRRTRLLPVPGRVLVGVGEEVAPERVLAEAERPGRLHAVDVAAALGLAPAQVPAAMVVAPGTEVAAGRVLARARGWLGLGGRECRAPVGGVLVSVSAVTGRALLEGPAEAVRVAAWLAGRIAEVRPGLGAVVECEAGLVQGVFGWGGERTGTLRLAVPGPDAVLDVAGVPADAAGAVLVAGAGVTAAAMAAAREAGVAAVISGAVAGADLLDLPEGEAALTGTGEATPGPALILTEGFGRVGMLPERFALLAEREGARACVAATTQIRAGALRPELVLPWPDRRGVAPPPAPEVVVGGRVRVVSPPWLGRAGRVAALPAGPGRLPSGAEAAVALIEFEPDGERAAVALANLEIV